MKTKDFITQVTKLGYQVNKGVKHERCKLTEEEIKRNHKYLWGFAEEVDE